MFISGLCFPKLSGAFLSVDALLCVQNLEEQILCERQRWTHERDQMSAQLQKASSEMERLKSALLLERVRQYNHTLVRRKEIAMHSWPMKYEFIVIL